MQKIKIKLIISIFFIIFDEKLYQNYEKKIVAIGGKFKFLLFQIILYYIALLFFLALNIITLFRFILIFSSVAYFDTSFTGSWALILLLLFIFTVFIFIESFKEEKAIRNKFIEIDD